MATKIDVLRLLAVNRQAFWSITLKNSADLMKTIVNEVWYPAIQPLMKVEGFVGALVFQPLTEPIIEHFAKNGDNGLGMDYTGGPLVTVDLDFQWNSTSGDDQILSIEEDIIAKSKTCAESRGLSHRYIDQNYACIKRDVFAGCGPQSKARLLKVQ
ncbi:hypothetical protein DOTSEDRAFT_27820 [Dothistroma septosporum NZE10]|uniref:Uncharacterized protein n=1 Tax=Dothistroma septosporum (strain NZE10 / CBS 128990) TaxID=675120 RepID=N1PE62_DOTSN|nr:hypothetical protein DOTSEDRAFT_27820 [Dothistroma septosporum NZE10]